MRQQEQNERLWRAAWDHTDEPWPFDREDFEIELRAEEWQDK